jgi:polyphosphate kinase
MAATKGQIKERKNGDEANWSDNGSLTRKAYDRELARLHGEFVKPQQWVVANGLKVVIASEGRDGAGKGGVIKAITKRVAKHSY